MNSGYMTKKKGKAHHPKIICVEKNKYGARILNKYLSACECGWQYPEAINGLANARAVWRIFHWSKIVEKVINKS
jgi:hypothetical protein